jgi:uncharacterized protein (TIGR03086 family)
MTQAFPPSTTEPETAPRSDPAGTSRAPTVDVLECLREAESRLQELTAELTVADLTRPTPCALWDVRALVSHTIGAMDMYSSFADAAAAPDFETLMAGGDLLGAAPHEAVVASCTRSRRAWSEPGVLERELQTYWGPWTGERVASTSALSTIVHGWDLAVAVGKRVELPANLLELSWEVANELAPVLREAGVMDAPVVVGDEATPTQRLLAFLGRDPSQAP